MLSTDKAQEAYQTVRQLSLGAHLKGNGAVEALIHDHEAAVRGLRVLATQKWQALGGGKGFTAPDEKWIQDEIEEATRERPIDKIHLAEGSSFSVERELADRERFAHDQGIGPDYAVEISAALHAVTPATSVWPHYFAQAPGYPQMFMTYDLDQLIDFVLSEVGGNLTVEYMVQDGPDEPRRVIGKF